MSRVSHAIDRVDVTFDEPNLVPNAGLLLIGTLVARLGLEALINSTVALRGRVGGALPGRKVLTLVHAIAAGGSHIDHVDVLRAGETQSVLPHRVMAPSTCGTFLRAFSFGHVRQLDAVLAETIRRAWNVGAGPGGGRLVVDVDSTICEVHGHHKAGAAYGYTRCLGYHPLLASRADTGEVLHARMRKGSAGSGRGAKRFCQELVARIRRAGATGEIVVRADSGFWSYALIDALTKAGVRWSITVRNTPAVAGAISRIDDTAWIDITYPDGGRAQVADTTYTTGTGRRARTLRLVVRRTRLTDPAQQRLWPDWRHHAFITDLDGDAVTVDAFHRGHATVELAIRDLKQGAGLEHVPSGNFWANSAWLVCSILAHNLIRWTRLLGDDDHPERLTVARTLRTRLLSVPGRLVNRSGTPTLRMPLDWPWTHQFVDTLAALRALPFAGP